MTAGSLSTQLGMFTKVAGNLSDADVSMTVSMDPTDERTATSSVIEATGTDAYVQACAVENVTRFGTSMGYQVSVEQEGVDFRLTLKK